MGKLEQYQIAITNLLQDYKHSTADVETHLITDNQHQEYQLMRAWRTDTGVLKLRIALHFQIKPDGKVWILANWTEDDVAQALVERGVAKSDIVLGFQPEYVRGLSGYATA